ncbi:MAG: MlaD family protein [Candidatus Cyclobacteriaceae bacterium M3_2C_046]
MKNKAQKIRLGIFVAVTATILIVLMGLFTTQRFFRERDVYFITYEGVSVSGLEVGSPVKFLGIKVGSVQDIRIDPEDVNQVIVKVAINPGTPIKADAQAAITTVGITGLKTIEIRGGSNQASSINEGGFIPAGTSMTEEITGKAEVIAEKVESVLNNLQQFTQPDKLNKISYMADSITVTATNITELVNRADLFLSKVNHIVENNEGSLNQAIANSNEISKSLLGTSQLLERTSKKINRIVDSDTINQILGGARDVAVQLKETNIKQLVAELGQIIEQTNELLVKLDNDIDRGSDDFTESMSLLKTTLQNLNSASQMINEDPSVLLRGTRMTETADKNLR